MINKFLHSICNCSDYCLTIDDINCSPDDITITIVLTLKEKQPLFLKNLIYSTLQERQVKVDQNYSIFCVVNTLCEKQTTEPPTTETITTPTIISTPTSEVTKENNAINFAIIIGITAVTLVVFLVLVIIAIILRLQRRKQNRKQISLDTLHVKNSHQSANENMASNKHPSTSSDESGFFEGQIKWAENEIYQDHHINPPKPPLTAPVPDCKPLATKEEKPNYLYDDILDISETTQRAGASHVHHKTKHLRSRPSDITQHAQSTCNNHNVPFHSVTTSRNVTISLNTINHNHLPSSQV